MLKFPTAVSHDKQSKQPHTLFVEVLAQLETLTLQRREDGFYIVGHPPDWLTHLRPALERQQPFYPALEFPFLEEFLKDAERLWAERAHPMLESGTWMETDAGGEEYPLEATAMCVGSQDVLLIQHLGASYTEKQEILQQARENSLLHERLMQAQHALRESLEQIQQAKQEWESTADSLSEIVCLLDNQGRVLRANRTVEHWNLCNIAKIGLRTVHELLHPECSIEGCYLEAFWKQAQAKLASGQSAVCEAADHLLKRDLRIQIRPILRKTNVSESSMAVVVVQDVTEQKRVEAIRAEVIELRATLGKAYVYENIVGKSKQMRELYGLMQQAAGSNITVLIQGESGTGKELVAKAIHFNGPRKRAPFVAVNCAAIPDSLIESELFGHERGAFTGATMRRIGKFEQANRGTIFLDEIAEMAPTLQAKLLRVMQEREVQRVGGNESIPIDVRVIAATNQDLIAAVERGTFREDLFYRVAAFPINLPPLRVRRDDIPLLVEHFMTHSPEAERKRLSGIAAEAMQLLIQYEWPGNVRELENLVQRAILLETSDVLRVGNPVLRELRAAVPGRESDMSTASEILPLEAVEQQAIAHALKATDNNISQAAQALGINRTTLHRKLRKFRMLGLQ